MTSWLTIPSAVQLLIYVTNEPEPSYYVGPLRVHVVKSSMVVLQTDLVSVLSHFPFCEIAEKVDTDILLSTLMLLRETEVD